MEMVTSPTKKIMYKLLPFACFWSTRQQLNFVWHSGRGVVSSIGLTSRVQVQQSLIFT